MCDVCDNTPFPSPKSFVDYIALNRKNIKIDNLQLLRLGLKIVDKVKCKRMSPIQFPDLKLAPFPGYPYILDWLFVVNVLNFGFCTPPNTKVWSFQEQRGYLGICAAVNSALHAGYDIINPRYYSKITQEDVNKIFCGDDNTPIPLVSERRRALNNTGTLLLRYYQGAFVNCLTQEKGSALRLLDLIARQFPYYCDKGFYENRAIIFHRKAQLLIVNIWFYFRNEGPGKFDDIDQLATVRSNHQLEQLFLYYKVFEYSEELQSLTKSTSFLCSGFPEEMEIRGCTIYATEMLKTLINESLGKKYLNPLLADILLTNEWDNKDVEANKKNIHHHMSRSVYY